MKKLATGFLFLSIFLVILLVSGCSSNDQGNSTQANQPSDQAEAGNKQFEGTTITALLPPWTNISADMLEQFEKETGIKVDLQTMGWDEIHDKIVTTAAAGVAPADITEFDWSWVGQFGVADWYEPLNKYFDESIIKDTPTMPIFQYDGNYLAMPYFNDFRVTYVNKKMFDQAGISELPKTPEDLMKAAEQVKAKGVVDYPLGLPLSATEGAATPWYLLTKAFGGDLFDENWQPQFTAKDSAGYKAMEFIINGRTTQELVDPAAVGMKDVDVIDAFKAGKSAIDLAGWSGNIALYQDPEKSQIADAVDMLPMPGVEGKSRTFGLVGAYGIPKASKNKEAAAEFIKWFIQPDQMKKLYADLGLLPNRQSVLEDLNKEGKLKSGETILQVLPTVEPLFKQGTPPWYPQFSIDVATTINQMAKGSMSIDDGIKHIADNASSLTK